MKYYFLRYRYKTYLTLLEWKEKSYKAKDINDLIEKINEIIRRYTNVYIINIYELEMKKNDK